MRLKKLFAGMLVMGAVICVPAIVSAQEKDGELAVIDFEQADLTENTNGIVSGNLSGNNSSIIDLDGNKVLKLGDSSGTENKCGVEITNGFAGHYELRQTLTEALENTGVTYNGTKDDMDENGYIKYMEGRTYPYPTYTNGLTMNFWVRLPAGVDYGPYDEEAPVLFAFTRIDETAGNGGMYMTAGGLVRFWEGDIEESVRNNFCSVATYADESNGKCEWHNVSVVFENDLITVYKDGVFVYSYMEDGYGYGYTRSRDFNKGFGCRGEHEAIIEYRSIEEAYKNYRDLLTGFSDEEKNAGDFSDYSKYTFLNSSGELLIDFITDENTKLYVGGDDGVCLWNMAEYQDSSDNVLYDDFKFYNYAADEYTAQEIYENAAEHESGYIEGIDPEQKRPVTIKRYYPVDVDGDKKVGLTDVTAILKIALGISDSGEYGSGDVDLDGSVTLKDASSALKYALGIEKYYPYADMINNIINVDFDSDDMQIIDSEDDNDSIYVYNVYKDKNDNLYTVYTVRDEIVYEDKLYDGIQDNVNIEMQQSELTDEQCKEITEKYAQIICGEDYYKLDAEDIFESSDIPGLYYVTLRQKIGSDYYADKYIHMVIDADGYIYKLSYSKDSKLGLKEDELKTKIELISLTEEKAKEQEMDNLDNLYGEGAAEILSCQFYRIDVRTDENGNIKYTVCYTIEFKCNGRIRDEIVDIEV